MRFSDYIFCLGFDLPGLDCQAFLREQIIYGQTQNVCHHALCVPRSKVTGVDTANRPDWSGDEVRTSSRTLDHLDLGLLPGLSFKIHDNNINHLLSQADRSIVHQDTYA